MQPALQLMQIQKLNSKEIEYVMVKINSQFNVQENEHVEENVNVNAMENEYAMENVNVNVEENAYANVNAMKSDNAMENVNQNVNVNVNVYAMGNKMVNVNVQARLKVMQNKILILNEILNVNGNNENLEFIIITIVNVNVIMVECIMTHMMFEMLQKKVSLQIMEWMIKQIQLKKEQMNDAFCDDHLIIFYENVDVVMISFLEYVTSMMISQKEISMMELI
ncbi:MAG: hypothetical protein EZS28_025693 [Streblomastix strix]|uniref:Uncharacterized protein n=1 Tax=Streblomastix strix TaxID=222440 RepID=A0A5J4V8G3_9EUKA|nr:MAG: hypothetical protein EZS28_025693 [Streblomastix strix]